MIWRRSTPPLRGRRLLLALALAAGACSSNDSNTRALDHEIDQVLRCTVPEGARVSGTAPLRRGRSSAETSWEVEAEQGWSSYQAALERDARAAGYQPGAPPGEAKASFLKPEAGDTYYLEVELLDQGPPIRVRVRFAARAG